MTLVQIELNPDQIIEQVYIGERPAKLYGSAEGSHTTAWSVIRFGLRNALIGLSISDAIQAATRLIKEAQALPGVSLAEGKDYDATLKDKYETARQAVTANKQSVQYQKNPNLAFLQTYASDYLEYRYVIPLSIAHFSKAKGAGESKSIRLLREQTNLERRKRNTQPKGKSEDVMKDESKDEGEEEGKGKSIDVRKEKREEIRKAMWAILDNKTVRNLVTDKP